MIDKCFLFLIQRFATLHRKCLLFWCQHHHHFRNNAFKLPSEIDCFGTFGAKDKKNFRYVFVFWGIIQKTKWVTYSTHTAFRLLKLLTDFYKNWHVQISTYLILELFLCINYNPMQQTATSRFHCVFWWRSTMTAKQSRY